MKGEWTDEDEEYWTERHRLEAAGEWQEPKAGHQYTNEELIAACRRKGVEPNFTRRDPDRDNDFGRNAWPFSPGDISGGSTGAVFFFLLIPSWIAAFYMNDEQGNLATFIFGVAIAIAVGAVFNLWKR